MKKMNSKYAVILALVTISLSACAHKASVERKVDEEVKAQAPVAEGGPLVAESRKLIMESTDISADQKNQLLELHGRMSKEIAALREEDGKLKMVLFKTLLNPKADNSEINNLKKRIVALDQKRLHKMLGAFEEARVILNHTTLRDDRLYRAFGMDLPGHGDFY